MSDAIGMLNRLVLVREGGYDTKVNETVNVVTTKTTEIGQKTWGIMRGVMALASQKVEEYTKEGRFGTTGRRITGNETKAREMAIIKSLHKSQKDGVPEEGSLHLSASSDKKTAGHNGKSDSNWTDGGFL
ncbi:putative ADP-ribosylation factor GTPase-activating protein AGD6 [Camellia lanceoleosa]|uniref:ADP-ribosylation factor GTPase-activating protein AGD6 n=1 Tax=Camellia lanceoleosa TaxID=1840588 RepID=A0ACC0HVF2_9ERIC|nr:putative ADP-ribosylation factor GTPase-activating protein AGD6 [Camellia lanceoleosa]